MANICENVVRTKDVQLLVALPELIKEKFYIAGGTGLALHLGHRYSYDFDLFTRMEFDPGVLKLELSHLGRVLIFQEAKGTLELAIDDTRVAFFHYPYPLVGQVVLWRGLQVASIEDIGAMKVMAISGRGSRKDFVDLYFICQQRDLFDLIQVVIMKFGHSIINLYHIIKSLSYFEDARKEPMPHMILSCEWSEVEEFFSNKQLELADKLL